MQRTGFKKIVFSFSPVFIALLHLPFVFAINRPLNIDQLNEHLTSLPTGVSTTLNSPRPDPASPYSAYGRLNLEKLGLSRDAFDYAIKGFNKLQEAGKLNNSGIITIIDFSRSSSLKRFFILDLNRFELLCNTYVSHGSNSGMEYARHFSNTPESNQSSLGFYQTGGTYTGKHGYSLKLFGMEKGFNDNAESRAIVMHAAPYVNEELARSRGYIGRSWGCPAIPLQLHKKIIEEIKGGTCLFIYSPDNNYLLHSPVING
jgi:hypothetical protein